MTVRPSRPPLANLRAIAGFTLIEILLVIVIIMLLAGALVAFVLPQQAGAEKNTTRLLLMQVQTALDNYRLNLGHYPTEDEGGLGALLAKPQFENEQLGERWQGPYLKPGTKLLDPWGRQITYDLQNLGAGGAGGGSGQTNGTPFRLFSLGPDGQPDTDDDVRLPSGNEAAADSKTVLDVEKK